MAMFRKKPVTVEAHQVPDPSALQAWGELAGWLLRHDCQALLDASAVQHGVAPQCGLGSVGGCCQGAQREG